MAGQDKAALDAKSLQIGAAMSRPILNLANLIGPFTFDPAATTKTRALKLIDPALAGDPRVAVLALRGPAVGAGELVLLGSTDFEPAFTPA